MKFLGETKHTNTETLRPDELTRDQAQFSGSHIFSLTATAKIYFRFALPAGMLYLTRRLQ